jgi:hypothetical protein
MGWSDSIKNCGGAREDLEEKGNMFLVLGVDHLEAILFLY